jgi:hypothetical protein
VDWNFEEGAVLARDMFFKRREMRIIKIWKGKRKWMRYVEMNFGDNVEVSFECHEIWGTCSIFNCRRRF